MEQPNPIRNLKELLTDEERKLVENAPQYQGTRHPTWFPLFKQTPLRAVDNLVNSAIYGISREPNGHEWLNMCKKPLLDFEDTSSASSVLAEIRAYGGLLGAGFTVRPIPRTMAPTPDYRVDAGDGEVIVEVFSKHQNKEEDKLLDVVHSQTAPLPPGVERNTRIIGDKKMVSTVVCITPGGKPDPSKPGDSVQANVISRLCGVKTQERQIPADKPAILVLDLAHFGGAHMSEFVTGEDACPIISGHYGIVSGPIWYAFYGWKGAPIFEMRRKVQMGHDGRFRLLGDKESRLSGVLVTVAKSSLFLENPWARNPLPPKARTALCRYPWMDLTRSIFNWNGWEALEQIRLHRSQIEALDAAQPWSEDGW